MRLWHYDMISFLPNKQLVGQWREIRAICGMINNEKFKDHPIVKKLNEYSTQDLYIYMEKVKLEMLKRDYRPSDNVYEYIVRITKVSEDKYIPFKNWHNERYLNQCYYNLEEKYDLGLITQTEWNNIMNWRQNYDKRETKTF